MREWGVYVQEHLDSLHEVKDEREQIAGELAGHLEEQYEALRANGLSDEEAFAQTCARAGDWKEMSQGIVSAKLEGTMSDRVRQIWIPSLVTLVSSTVIMSLLIWATRPVIARPGDPRGAILYVPWLLLLPVIGAIGGYLSRRAQASGWRVYVAGLFPALAMAFVFIPLFPFAFFIDPKVSPEIKFTSLLAMLVSWVILPGFALCIGVVLQGLRRSSEGLQQ